MEETKGLKEYVSTRRYRSELGLPEKMEEEYHMLAQGEYNRNYWFIHPVSGKKLVLRINFGSQMHLQNQVNYEYEALHLIHSSGRTPAPFYVDGSRQHLDYGVMVMEYLPGHSLDYNTELLRAAGCLADIHCVRIPKNNVLVIPDNPLQAILSECEEMFRVYEDFPLAEPRKKEAVRKMLAMGREKANIIKKVPYRCCINTELNSTNFLMNQGEEKDYLIDWEKPLYGDPAQDLGHFLAPTTTFWKTDVILDHRQTEAFIMEYMNRVDSRFSTEGLAERTAVYIPITCLRGICWCAMAWVQYQQPEKAIFNASTYEKLESYLSKEFLEKIWKYL